MLGRIRRDELRGDTSERRLTHSEIVPATLTPSYPRTRRRPLAVQPTYLAAVAIEHGEKTRGVRVTEVQRHDVCILLRCYPWERSRVNTCVGVGRDQNMSETPKRDLNRRHVPCRHATPASPITRTLTHHSLPSKTPWWSPERSDSSPFGQVVGPRRHSAGYRDQSGMCPVRECANVEYFYMSIRLSCHRSLYFEASGPYGRVKNCRSRSPR